MTLNFGGVSFGPPNIDEIPIFFFFPSLSPLESPRSSFWSVTSSPFRFLFAFSWPLAPRASTFSKILPVCAVPPFTYGGVRPPLFLLYTGRHNLFRSSPFSRSQFLSPTPSAYPPPFRFHVAFFAGLVHLPSSLIIFRGLSDPSPHEEFCISSSLPRRPIWRSPRPCQTHLGISFHCLFSLNFKRNAPLSNY